MHFKSPDRHPFIVVRVICVYDLGKEIDEACQVAAFYQWCERFERFEHASTNMKSSILQGARSNHNNNNKSNNFIET